MTTSTRNPRNRSRKPACGRALADHQFLGCLERTAATETWESRTHDGRRWLVKVLFNVLGTDPKRADALQRLQSLKHPHLVPAVLVPGGPGCLVIAVEYPAATLFDLLKQFQSDGKAGIPRELLLGWLRTAATTLDELATEQGVCHFSLTPRQLLVTEAALLIAEHGLTQLMWLPTGQLQGQVQPRYAAPELPDLQRIGPACDQFSLAAIFQELLTGIPPFRARPLAAPDLAPLAALDRPVVARALDFDPKQRFSSCLDLIDALENVGAVTVVPLAATEPISPSTLVSNPEPAATPEPVAEVPLAAPAAEHSVEQSEEFNTIPLPARRSDFVNDLLLETGEPPLLTAPAESITPASDPSPSCPAETPVAAPLDDCSSRVELNALSESKTDAAADDLVSWELAPPPLPSALDLSCGSQATALPEIVEAPQAVDPVVAEIPPPPFELEPPTSAPESLLREIPLWENEAPVEPVAPVDHDSAAASPSHDGAAVEPAAPVEPTRLWNEGQSPSSLPVVAAVETSLPPQEEDEELSGLTSTIPFQKCLPAAGAPDSLRGFSFLAEPTSDAALPPDLTEACPVQPSEPSSELEHEEAVAAGHSPFDPNFVPTADGPDSPSDWPFSNPAQDGVNAMEGVGSVADSAVAVADERSDAAHAFTQESGFEAYSESAPVQPDSTDEPFTITLRTARLLPESDGEAPLAQVAQPETPKPIFRTLRSLRRDHDSHKSRTVPAGKASGRTAPRKAVDLNALLDAAAKAVPPNEPERWLSTEEDGEVLECRFPASLPPSGPPIDFQRLRDKWNAHIVNVDEDAALFEVGSPKQFWKRLLGRPTPLLVEVRWSRPRPPAVAIPGVTVRVRLATPGDKKGSATLHRAGPQLVESLRSQLQGRSERRQEKRSLWVQPVAATFLLSNGEASGTVEGQSRDLTSTGMGLYLPRILPGTQVSLLLADPAAAPITVFGKFVRVQRCGDGWYEVGVRFELEQ